MEMGARRFATWSEALEDRGLQRGLQQGLQEGVNQERQREASRLRSILRTLIENRIEAVPDAVCSRIELASVEELNDWIHDALTCPSMEGFVASSRFHAH